MADNEDDSNPARPPHSHIETQDHAPAPMTESPSPMPDGRRISTSSAGMSTGGRDMPASMYASQTSIDSSSNPRRQRPRPLDYGMYLPKRRRYPEASSSISTDRLIGTTHGSGRQQSHIPAQSPRTPRPQATRMPSSAAPYRGQAFSVDDDPEEVEVDMSLARQRTRQEQRERQLRRTGSTIRRRPTAQVPTLRTVESDEREEDRPSAHASGHDAAGPVELRQADSNGDPSSEDTLQGDEEEEGAGEEEEADPATPDDEDDDADLSDAESFTLKDRQEAINETHPFGIRIWKPALYKKSRSVQRNAEGDIHSAPGGNVSKFLFIFNCLWVVIFGWWLSLVAGFGGVINIALSKVFGIESCWEYGRVLINLSHYLVYPFGKYVKLEHDEAYLDEDEGEGRSVGEYERWQTGDLEEGRLFFGPPDVDRSIIGRRRDEIEDLEPRADETDSLLGRPARQNSTARAARSKTKKRLFGRGKWNVGRVIFFLSFYFLVTPCLFLVSGICWFLVFTIPMGKVTLLLFYHLRRHPLALSFHTDSHYARTPSSPRIQGHSVLLCTYRAVGLKYWKYTIDGTNIFLINLLGLVAFVIFDYFVLFEALGHRSWITSLGLIFALALASIIPLAYFIGQAVASISAQSSMGVGATINAFFSTVVEVFLYCIALQQGKSQLVEGSIIGSIFAGILFLPGLSMCFGAIRRKTQRFNVKSAGVTSTMLLFAVIGAFGPTLFYQIYGSHELNCHQCVKEGGEEDRDCRRCYFSQVTAIQSRFFQEAVQPYIWFAAVCLFLSYLVGLLFTLRTHAAVIWNNEPDEKKDAKMDEAARKYEERHGSIVPGSGGLAVQDPPTGPRPGMARGQTAGTIGSLAREDIRDSVMYKRILQQSLKQAGLRSQSSKKDLQAPEENASPVKSDRTGPQAPFIVPPKSSDGDSGSMKGGRIQGLSAEDNRSLIVQVAEMAATAATVAARDATKAPMKSRTMATTAAPHGSTKQNHSGSSKDPKDSIHRMTNIEPGSLGDASDVPAETPGAGGAEKHEEAPGGHDAPNWSRTKSAVILLTATVAYAVIAEILVDTVDAVLSNSDIDEKFLGITLFALVPNTTEFLNAISFAMNGNVALSMEIGSSYALQVMLLQIPCLVLFSAFYINYVLPEEALSHTFMLIFPQWDMVTVILGVFLMGWVVGEGKSNYFKGSTLIFTYAVVVVGFWFSGYGDMETMGVNRFDTLAINSSPQMQTFKTIGRSRSGRAF